MNILTFDIEEWYLEREYFGNHAEKFKVYDIYLDKILARLEEQGFKATFFCVGGMAKHFPEVIKKIDAAGHEVGCHSYKHVWLNKMTPEDLYKDTYIAVDALEQCLGKKVKSYRAPAFTIGMDNKYALEVLYDCGIRRDASIFPAERDFGGFSQFGGKKPTLVFYKQTKIKEFPICTTRFLGKDFVYSGGGYFRFFPLSFVRRAMSKSDYTMTYFHISDLILDSTPVMSRAEYEAYFKQPGTLKNRYLRHLKSNLGKDSAFDKLMRLVDLEEFINLEQADQIINWETVPSVVLK